MKRIKKDEIFRNVTKFLKGRGVELTEGAYAARIQKGCSALTEMVNLSRDGIERATTEVDKQLEHLRQAVHEATAPGSAEKAAGAKPGSKPAAKPGVAPEGKAAAKPGSAKAAKPAPKTGRSKSR
jgi:hypothetical protein